MKKYAATPSRLCRSSATRSRAFLARAASAAAWTSPRETEDEEARERGFNGARSRSMVATDRVVYGAVQGDARASPRLALQCLSRRFRQAAGAVAPVGESSGPLDDARELRPLRPRPALAQSQRLELASVRLRRVPQGGDQGKGDLALREVGSHGLSGDPRITKVVEQVIHDLKPHPHQLAKATVLVPPSRSPGPAVEPGANLRGRTDQRSGLGADQLLVLLLGDVEIVGILEL